MVRGCLAPDGVVRAGCDLFVRTKVDRDIDIRDYRRVAPGTTVIDCSREDCVRNLSNDRCQYYVRSAACFFHPDGLPPRCIAARSDAEIMRECLVPECRAFEVAADLAPVEGRSLYPRVTFPNDSQSYPERIPVGFFRVGARGGSASGLSAEAAAGCGHTGDTQVLSANAGTAIERAFARLQPTLTYDDVQVACDHAVVRLCTTGDAPAVCFSVRLDPWSPGCAEPAGGFCVTFLDGSPTASAAARVLAELRAVDRTALWSDPTRAGQ